MFFNKVTSIPFSPPEEAIKTLTRLRSESQAFCSHCTLQAFNFDGDGFLKRPLAAFPKPLWLNDFIKKPQPARNIGSSPFGFLSTIGPERTPHGTLCRLPIRQDGAIKGYKMAKSFKRLHQSPDLRI
jgi:hypothetical protein